MKKHPHAKESRLRVQGLKTVDYRPGFERNKDLKLIPLDLTKIPSRVQQLLRKRKFETYPYKTKKDEALSVENNPVNLANVEKNASVFMQKIYQTERKSRSNVNRKKDKEMNAYSNLVPSMKAPETIPGDTFLMKHLKNEAAHRMGWKKDAIKIDTIREEPKKYDREYYYESSLNTVKNKLAERFWDRGGQLRNGVMQKTKEDLKNAYNLVGRNSPNAWDIDENSRRHFGYR